MLVKSPHNEKGKKWVKKGILFFFPHPRNNSLKDKTPYLSKYHVIKLLHFSSSLKPHI